MEHTVVLQGEQLLFLDRLNIRLLHELHEELILIHHSIFLSMNFSICRFTWLGNCCSVITYSMAMEMPERTLRSS